MLILPDVALRQSPRPVPNPVNTRLCLYSPNSLVFPECLGLTWCPWCCQDASALEEEDGALLHLFLVGRTTAFPAVSG